MKILNRYILTEFIKSFIISMLIVYSILIIQLMIKLLDRFLGKGFSFSFLGLGFVKENPQEPHFSIEKTSLLTL